MWRSLVSLSIFLIMLPGSFVFAQEAGNPEGPGLMMQIVPFAVMFFIFYFLMIRPQVQKQKTHQDFITALKKGDQVLTSSGIFGTIEGLTEKYVTLEIAEEVNIRVLRTHVSQAVKEG
ncbi:MAG: preprotein translocase subunit YajC [Pseudomonadota bacterium]